MGADASCRIGHVVVETNGMINGKGPKSCICNIGPVYSRMEKHRARDGHNGLDRPLGDTIMVMRADARVVGDLGKCLEMGLVCLRCEGRAIVAQIL